MLGQIAGGLIGAAARRLGSERIVRLGAALAAAGAWCWPSRPRRAPLTAVVLPMVVYLFGCSFIIPNAMAPRSRSFRRWRARPRRCGRIPGSGRAAERGLAAALWRTADGRRHRLFGFARSCRKLFRKPPR
jgi:hypothetical protein